MQILEKFLLKIKDESGNIGIGLGESQSQNIKILKVTTQFLRSNKSSIFLFGFDKAIKQLKSSKFYTESNKNISLMESKDPYIDLIKFLLNGKLKAIIRGGLDSHDFLKEVKKKFNISKIHRLALLETFEGFQFFFAPVGIDEANNLKDKIEFLDKAIETLNSLKIEPKISILSGGRENDIGRDLKVDETILMAKKVVDSMHKKKSNIMISHDEILIENAINKKSNLIIAPDGISGNLIYRTLVHLGGGKAYGAIYMGLHKIIIDTSRVSNETEIRGALILALALS
jgi:putative methanogen marker protein 4